MNSTFYPSPLLARIQTPHPDLEPFPADPYSLYTLHSFDSSVMLPLLCIAKLAIAVLLTVTPSVFADLTTTRRLPNHHRTTTTTRSIVKRVNTDPIAGASIQNLTLSSGSLSAWISNGPVPQNIESVVISTHGVDGNARDYYLDINAAWV